MKYAIIDRASLIVVNVALWDGKTPWHPGDEYMVVESDIADIGDKYDPESGTFNKV